MTRRPKEPEADFLSRWSERKRRQARHAPEEPEPPAEAPAPADAPQRTEAEILEELGLPDPETLGPGSDFRAFMAEAVPDFIRRKALRRLWTSNPAFAHLDMLVEYGEDYTDKATVVANLQSAYQAGRGYLDRLAKEPPAPEAPPEDTGAAETAEDAAPGAEEAAEADPAQAADAPEEPATASAEAGEPDTAPPDAADPPAAESPEHSTLAEAPPPRRRMRFVFDDG